MSPKHGGAACDVSPKEEVEPCNTQPCNSFCHNGTFGSWQDWSHCSASCGGGTSVRTRRIERSANDCGFAPEGKDRETQYCNVHVSCQKPQDCQFGEWDPWSDCSCSCWGTKRRQRRVTQYGYGTGTWCKGDLREIGPCNPGQDSDPSEECEVEQPLDCQMESWSEWSKCTEVCNGGERTRNRDVKSFPKNGGKSCDGENGTHVAISETEECNRYPCKGEVVKNCEISDWEDWGGCYKCGGTRKRFRHIAEYPTESGRPCPQEDLDEVGSCPRKCGEPEYCTWQNWGKWSACSAHCGDGTRSRKRYLMKTSEPSEMPATTQELMLKYNALLRQTNELDSDHMQDLVIAFACGGLTLVVGFGAMRFASRRSRGSHVPQSVQNRLSLEENRSERQALFDRDEQLSGRPISVYDRVHFQEADYPLVPETSQPSVGASGRRIHLA